MRRINRIAVNQTLNDQTEADNFMASIGWTVDSPNNYSITTEDLWGQINLTLNTIPFSFSPVITGAEKSFDTNTVLNVTEDCQTVFGYTRTICTWGSSGVTYRYFFVSLPIQSQDNFLQPSSAISLSILQHKFLATTLVFNSLLLGNIKFVETQVLSKSNLAMNCKKFISTVGKFIDVQVSNVASR